MGAWHKCIILLLSLVCELSAQDRLRDLGLTIGIFSPGQENSITDVEEVLVGHVTLHQGDTVHTGVTAILPHSGNVFQSKVPAAIFVGNGFGKLAGSTQVRELGNIESPIILTNTLNVAEGIAGGLEYVLSLPGNELVRSANVVVGETNDGYLNDIRGRHLSKEHVIEAIRSADKHVEEGNVGAGTGTICFGFKGGIGTSSRALPEQLGGYKIGVLVQSNFGGILEIAGVPVGKEMGQYAFGDIVGQGDGSCMIVVATDAPLDSRNLYRLAKRAFMGLAKTGGFASNGSGDYVIAFSTAKENRRSPTDARARPALDLTNRATSPLFQAVLECTEEAIHNSLMAAETMAGHRGTIKALPIDRIKTILKKYGRAH